MLTSSEGTITHSLIYSYLNYLQFPAIIFKLMSFKWSDINASVTYRTIMAWGHVICNSLCYEYCSALITTVIFKQRPVKPVCSISSSGNIYFFKAYNYSQIRIGLCYIGLYVYSRLFMVYVDMHRFWWLYRDWSESNMPSRRPDRRNLRQMVLSRLDILFVSCQQAWLYSLIEIVTVIL